MPVEKRHPRRGIGVEHLLGGDDLDLIGESVQTKLAARDVFNGVMDFLQRFEGPVLAFKEEALAHFKDSGALSGRF